MVCIRNAVALFLLAGGLATAHAQDARLANVLERVAAASDAQKQFLPSFECREDVIAQNVRKNKVEEEGRMSATIRVQKAPSGRLDETFVSFTDPAARNALPWYVTGGFGLALEYFTREHQACYRYELKGDRLIFKAKPHDQVASFGCSNPDGITGEAMVDASDDIVRIERNVPENQADHTGLVPYAAIDVAPLTLDGREFRVSRHIASVSQSGKTYRHFEATYSNCKLFGATVTIHAGAPVDEPQTSP